MHGSTSGRSFSELPGIFRRLWMQNAAHVSILMCSDPPPLPAQTTRILTTEVVATSQMHLGRMFREWFPEFDVRWLSNGVFIE